MTAGQVAAAFSVWVTPYPKSDVANMLPGKTGPHTGSHSEVYTSDPLVRDM